MPDVTTRREQLDMQLLRRYHHHQDRSARARMVERGMPLVRSLARPYANRGEELDDLVQVGSVGLVNAIDRYDPECGHRFVSYAAPNITGEIKRHFRDHCWALHVPRSVQELDARIARESQATHARTGRDATVAELAQALGVTRERIGEAMVGGRAYRSLSLDHPTGETRDALDLIGDADGGYAAVDRHEEVLDACSALDDREREMVLLRYYDEQLQREIAERFGVSQMQVSRILAGALEKMHDHLGGDDADPQAAVAGSAVAAVAD